MRSREGERGQTVIEFALALPILLLVLVGIFDIARMTLYTNTLAHAAREGTRYAITHGAGAGEPSGPPPLDDAAIRDVVARTATGVNALEVAVSWPDGDSERGSRVAVEATSPYVPTLSQYFLNGALRITLRGASQMTIVR